LTLGQCAIGKFPIDLKEDNPLWEMMMNVQEECALSIRQEEFSTEFNDFLQHCLNVDPKMRPSAEELLEHDFIKKKYENEITVGRWLDINFVQVVKKIKQQKKQQKNNLTT
jgi:serine/threonine protein kinase